MKKELVNLQTGEVTMVSKETIDFLRENTPHNSVPVLKFYRLYSDNFDGALIEMDAYRELTLHMSTGDWHTHRTELVVTDRYPDEHVFTMGDLFGEE